MMMGAAPRQQTAGPKTLQAFVDEHWQLRFTVHGGVMCICCSWAAETDCPGVKRPPKAAAALVNGTYGMGMRMMIATPKGWRKDVLEGHLGVARGTTRSRKKIDNPGRHHLAAEESFRVHCAERFRALCPSASASAFAVNVAERSIVFIRGEGMDLGGPMSDAVAAILSRLVEVYIGLRMCTSIRAISERILLHCAFTSDPGHHASRRWIVERAMVAMHGAMQDGVSETLQRALFIALLLDGSDRQRHRINEYAILLLFPGTGPGGMCEVFLGVVDVASGEAQEVTAQVEAVLLSRMPDRAWWAQKVVAFAVDGASNLGVRGATARQAVDVSAMEHNVFAMLVKWLSLLTPLGEPCHVVQRKLALALEAAGQVHADYLAAVGRQRALYNGARQWKDLERCVQENTRPETRSRLRRIPASHRIRWSEANARRNKVFLANVPWVARHLDSKTHLPTKEEDVWEDCHDAGLLSWAVVYGDILHGTRSFNNVAQLHAPTGAHLTKATEMLQARVEMVAREEGPGWTQFKEQTLTGAWHGVELVRFDADGQRCTTSPPFPATEARAVTDTLLAGIREGQGTIDPRGVLECAVLLDHGRWLALPAADRATFGVDLLKQFMGTHHAELAAAHVNAARALEEWESFKEHVVRTFAKTPMSCMWEALTPEREHVQWVNVWRVLALLRTYCPAEAAVERAISLRGRFTNSMHDMEDTHVLSMCMALHCNLPPLRQWAKGQGVEVASKLAANARFDVRPRHRVSHPIDPRTSVEAAMLQCLEGEAAVADDGDILPSFGGSEVPLACQGATRRRADRQAPSEHTEGTLVEPDGSPAQHGGNHDFFTFRRGMDCAMCRQSVRIWCNTCLVCHTPFVKDPRPCGEAVVQVVDDSAEAAENNSEEEAVAPRKSDPKRALARAQAKLVCAAKSGTLRDSTRARICDCLASMGVKVPNSKTRGDARELAMQELLPLLAQMDCDSVPPTDRVTRSAAPPSSSQPCSQVPVDDMDGLIDEGPCWGCSGIVLLHACCANSHVLLLCRSIDTLASISM